MQRILYALICAAIGGLLSYFLADIFTRWYGPRYIKSDSDINEIYIICLAFMALFFVIGAIVGFLRGRKPS